MAEYFHLGNSNFSQAEIGAERERLRRAKAFKAQAAAGQPAVQASPQPVNQPAPAPAPVAPAQPLAPRFASYNIPRPGASATTPLPALPSAPARQSYSKSPAWVDPGAGNEVYSYKGTDFGSNKEAFLAAKNAGLSGLSGVGETGAAPALHAIGAEEEEAPEATGEYPLDSAFRGNMEAPRSGASYVRERELMKWLREGGVSVK